MAVLNKYEKIDAQNIRKWTYDEANLVRVDLLAEKASYQAILNQATVEKEKIRDEINPHVTITQYDALFQARVDEIDYYLALFNATTTSESIDFVDE